MCKIAYHTRNNVNLSLFKFHTNPTGKRKIYVVYKHDSVQAAQFHAGKLHKQLFPMARSRKEIQYTLHDHADLSFHCHFQWMLLKIDNSPKSGLVPPSTHRDRPGGRGDVYSDYHLTNPCRQQPARRFVTVLPSLCLAVL